MGAKIFEVFLILVGSAFKYSFATLFAADSSLGTIPAFLANFLGGVWGVFVFVYLEEKIQKWYINRQKRKGTYRVFSRRNRFIIKLRKRFGLKGLAVLTPILLTIPLGVAISLSLTHNKKMIVRYILLSCFFWTTVILLPYKLIGIDISKWIMSFFH